MWRTAKKHFRFARQKAGAIPKSQANKQVRTLIRLDKNANMLWIVNRQEAQLPESFQRESGSSYPAPYSGVEGESHHRRLLRLNAASLFCEVHSRVGDS